jgi:hypothetical protein
MQTLQNTEGSITNVQSRENDNIGYTRLKQTKQIRNMCWTPLCANKYTNNMNKTSSLCGKRNGHLNTELRT